VTFIGDYFGLAATKNGFFPLWTDTRTGLQELFTADVQITNHARLPSGVIENGDIVRFIGALDEPSYTVVIRGGVIIVIPGGPGPGPQPGPGPGADQELARLEGRAREALGHLRLAVKELQAIHGALDARQAAATRRAAT
jgi:hypothetical protein